MTPLYGDLFGRKVVLQAALVLFLVGSALCGLLQNLTQLIAFRAVQGLGGGGLKVSAQAARQEALGRLVADWDPVERAELAPVMGRLAEELTTMDAARS